MMKIIKNGQQLVTSPRAILVIQLGDLGDVVLTMPCIRALRENFPETRIVVAVRDKAAGLLDSCPWATECISLEKKKGNMWLAIIHQMEIMKKMRRNRFDLAFDFRTGTRGALLAALSGARQRIGFFAHDGKLWRNRIFTHLVHHDYQPVQYVGDHLLDLLRIFGIHAEHSLPEMQPSQQNREEAASIFRAAGISNDRPVIALQPFSLWEYKELTIQKYIQLIQWIRLKYDYWVIVTGSPDERDRAELIAEHSGFGVFNLAGKTSISLLPAILRMARLFIGIDSAGLHIAAAVGTPTIGIFGPSSPISWAPRGNQHLIACSKFDCVPCRQKGCNGSEKSDCLDKLDVLEIQKNVEMQIDRIFHA